MEMSRQDDGLNRTGEKQMRPRGRPYLSIQSSGVCDEGERGVTPVVDRYVLVLYSIVDLLVDMMRLGSE